MKVRELLNKDNWIQGNFATDENGDIVGTAESNAVCFCLYGAICRCYGKDFNKIRQVTDKIRHKLKKKIIIWNDDPERTWEDVHKLISDLDI